jgi:hypothetical protein
MGLVIYGSKPYLVYPLEVYKRISNGRLLESVCTYLYMQIYKSVFMDEIPYRYT